MTIVQVVKQFSGSGVFIAITMKTSLLDEYSVGLVEGADENGILFAEYDEDGTKNPSAFIPYEEIQSVEYNDRHLIRFELLIKNNTFDRVFKQITVRKNETIFIDRIRFLIQNKNICTVVLIGENYITGLIEEVNEDCIYIMNIGREGDFDGYTVVLFKLVKSISYNGLEESIIDLYYRNRNNLYDMRRGDN